MGAAVLDDKAPALVAVNNGAGIKLSTSVIWLWEYKTYFLLSALILGTRSLIAASFSFFPTSAPEDHIA